MRSDEPSGPWSFHNPFDAGVAEALAYDAWYDTPAGRSVLEAEQECVRSLLGGAPRPWIELGAGTGRFGGAVDADLGLDPAPAMLGVASARMPAVARAVAEALPLRDGCAGAVLAVTVLEFVADPLAAMREMARVLRPDGRAAIGFIQRGSPWAETYAERGRDPASAFHGARFLALEDLEALSGESGLRLVEVRCALFAPPGMVQPERTARTLDSAAGFVAVSLAASDEVDRRSP